MNPSQAPVHAAPKATTARDRALRALMDCFAGGGKGRDILEAMQARSPLSPLDDALAHELVAGVLRHRLTLEHIAAHFYRGRWAGLPESLRLIMALAVYQLCWLDRVPAHAAVNEAVRAARRRGKGAAATVNAVLRKVEACRGDVTDRPDSPDPRRWLLTDAFRGRMFTEDLFPDPARRPLEHLVAFTSHPMFLVERWHRRLKPRLARQVCEAGASRPPLVLRPNLRRITAEALYQQLLAAGQSCRVDNETGAVTISDGVAVTDLPQFRDGLCQPQDSAAQRVLASNPPRAGEFVLDFCAGVGTKATQAAELMGDRGLVLAHDVDETKPVMLHENAGRLGLSIIRTVPPGELQQACVDAGRAPDIILVDVPCTNTGVLARRLEARYRATHRRLVEVALLQRDILEQAARLAATHTRILYSTCSIELEENEQQTRWFCERFSSWHIAREETILPDRDHGGGYWALLKQTDESSGGAGG